MNRSGIRLPLATALVCLVPAVPAVSGTETRIVILGTGTPVLANDLDTY